MSKRKPTPYINNKHFYEAMKVFHASCQEAKAKGQDRPPIPDYVVLCFMEITEKYASKANFAGYSYLDDMKSDALMDCVKYAHVFNPSRGKNPFAFFTQTIKNAFIRRIEAEKLQSIIKAKVRINAATNSSPYDENEQYDENGDFVESGSKSLSDLIGLSETVNDFERRQKEKKEKRKKNVKS